MNKEYIYISDNEIIVSDEKGHTTRRSIDVEDINNLLLLENKLEKVNDEIDDSQEKINYRKELLPRLKKGMGKGLLIVSIVTVIFHGACVPISFYDALISFALVEPTFLASFGIAYKVCNKIINKEIKGYENKLGVAIELKEDYEKKINETKKLTNKDNVESIDNEKNITNVRNVVSLDKENENISTKISEYLQESYDKGYNEKELVLKKK